MDKNKSLKIGNINPFSALAFLSVAIFIVTQFALISLPGLTLLFLSAIFLYVLSKGKLGGISFLLISAFMVIYLLSVDLLDHNNPASNAMRDAMLYQILYCALLYLYCVLDKKNIRYVLWFVIFAVFIFLVSIIRDETFIKILTEGADDYQYYTKDEVNRNVIGEIVGVGAIFFFHFSMTKNRLFVIPTVVSAFVGLMTGSRKSIFASLVGVLLYSFFHLQNQKEKKKKRVGIILLVLLILLVLIYLCYSNETLYNIIGYRIEGLVGAWFGGESQEASAVGRAEMVEKAMEMFWEKPIFGWGIEGFALNGGYGVYSHNNYTEVLTNFGIVGFLVFYVYKVVILYHQYRLMRSSENQEELSLNIFLTVWLILLLMLDYGAVSMNSFTNNMAFAIAAAWQFQCKKKMNTRGARL